MSRDVYFGSKDVPASAVERVGGAGTDDPVAKAIAALSRIEAEEARLAKGLDVEDPVAKAERLLTEVESSTTSTEPMGTRRDPSGDPAGLNSIKSRDIQQFAKSLGIGTGPGAYDELRRRATKRDVDAYLERPEPPLCAGPGVKLMSTEKMVELAKKHGSGQSEADWKRSF